MSLWFKKTTPLMHGRDAATDNNPNPHVTEITGKRLNIASSSCLGLVATRQREDTHEPESFGSGRVCPRVAGCGLMERRRSSCGSGPGGAAPVPGPAQGAGPEVPGRGRGWAARAARDPAAWDRGRAPAETGRVRALAELSWLPLGCWIGSGLRTRVQDTPGPGNGTGLAGPWLAVIPALPR